MGPVAQLVFKTSAVVQPTARSVRLRRRSVSRNPLRQEVFGVSAAGTHQIPPTAQDRPRPLESGAHWRATGAHSARESEIAPSSPKVRRELFEIVLQEQIFFAAR